MRVQWLFGAMFSAWCLGCDGGNGEDSGDRTNDTGAITVDGDRVEDIVEMCCDEDGTFRDDLAECAAAQATYGLSVDFCVIEWPEQTVTVTAPFLDPICELDCAQTPANTVIGCVAGSTSGSFEATYRNNFDIEFRDGQPFSWSLYREGAPSRDPQDISRYGVIIFDEGLPMQGTYPIGPTNNGGQVALQSGFVESSAAPDLTYSHTWDDPSFGQITFFQAPLAFDDVVIGAYDYTVDVVSYTNPLQPTSAGQLRVQACFNLTAF